LSKNPLWNWKEIRMTGDEIGGDFPPRADANPNAAFTAALQALCGPESYRRWTKLPKDAPPTIVVGVAEGRFWTVVYRHQVAIAYLNCPGDKVNTLKGEAIEELGLIVDEAAVTSSWKALAITTSRDKPGISGANVYEIADLVKQGDGIAIVKAVERVKQVLVKLSRLPIPTVAMMNGPVWLGGGFELASWCDYRIGTKKLQVGLPEVKLGIFPGAGGTQKVPRLMARVIDAIDFITSLKNLSADEALDKGLIDEIAADDGDDGDLLDRALKYCRKSAGARARLRRRLHLRTRARRAAKTIWELKGLFGPRAGKVAMETLAPALLERLGGPGRYWLLQNVNKKIRDKTLTSSALAAARLVMDSRDLPLEEALAHESAAFASEALSRFTLGATFLFTHKGGARDAFSHVDIPRIDSIGIVGAGGTMGAGIAALYAAAPEIEKLVLIDEKPEFLAAALRRIEKHLETLSKSCRQAALAKIVTATDYAALVDCQAIIEAVLEDVALKQSVYERIADAMGTIERRVRIEPVEAGAVWEYYNEIRQPYYIFTNTSALSLDRLASGMAGGLEIGALKGDAGRFAGLHFFNPPEAMNVVEVPRALCTTDETMAVGMHLAAIAGKAPIPCANQPGFVVNRILGPYLVMTAWLLAMGVAPEEIDRAMKHAGAPMGPTVLLDKVGVHIAARVAETLQDAFGERMALPGDDLNVLKILLDRNDLGKKTGAGIYLWQDGKPQRDHKGRPIVNPALKEALPGLGKNETMARESIQYLLLGAVINEALRAVEDGVVAPEHLKWIDVAFSLGTGVDAVYGGPLHHLDAWGVRTFARLTDVIARCGGQTWRKLFVPCALLEELSSTGESFESYLRRRELEAAGKKQTAGGCAA
jgi:3-hydroxyacyl-CoA dehydrogenase/enoyl-CoA hydratase/3-hydroxybutyryl-CoA epimerase/enoyl-CoA isomerase